MDVISISIHVAELVLWAIILYYVCEYIGVPQNPKRACQILIILIAILASIQIVLAGNPPSMSRSLSSPSIIAPERR
jgi:hypothetical protein